MKMIDVGEEGLRKFNCYGQTDAPVKPEGEIWISVKREDLPLVAEGLQLVEEKTRGDIGSFQQDLTRLGISSEEAPQDQVVSLKDRASRATQLVEGFRLLTDNPDSIARLSREVI